MKSKYLALGLSVLLILSLASCGGQQTPKPEEPKQEVQQAEPISAQPVVAPEGVKPEIVPTASEQLQEITHDELIEVFEKEYEISKGVYNSDSEDTIQGELLAIQFTVDSMDKSLPSDYEAQYRAWRPSVVQQQASAQAQAQELTFSEVNEAVWTTGQVNLRSGPSTNDEKVGQLQKGNSVTRVGIGTGDYVDWSRVQLSDGSIVYVASTYLTTTKPTTQTSKGSTVTQIQTQTQTQTQTKPSGGTPQQAQGTPQGNYSEDGMCLGPDPSQVFKTGKSTDKTSINPWDGAELLIGYGS